MSENREIRLNQGIYPEMSPEMGFGALTLAIKSLFVDVSVLNAQKLSCLEETAAKLP